MKSRFSGRSAARLLGVWLPVGASLVLGLLFAGAFAACGGGGGYSNNGGPTQQTGQAMVGTWLGTYADSFSNPARTGNFILTVAQDYTYDGNPTIAPVYNIHGHLSATGGHADGAHTLGQVLGTATTGQVQVITSSGHLTGTLSYTDGTVTIDLVKQ